MGKAISRHTVFARWLVAAGAIALTPPTAASAQPHDDAFTKSAARSLAQEGDALFAKGDYAGALDRFDRARSLIQAPTLDVRRARILAKLGRLLEAEEQYLETATTKLPAGAPDAFAKAVDEARTELESLKRRIPNLVIERDPGVGAVQLDGKLVADALLGVNVPVDPGERVIAGDGAATLTIQIGEGETRRVRLAPGADDAPPPPGGGTASAARAHRIGAIAAFGVGAVGLGLGIGFGAAAIAKQDDLDAVCDPETGNCPLDAQDDIDSFETVGALSTVGFIVAAVGAGAGAVLLLTAPTEGGEARAALRLYASPAGAGLTGTF